MVHLKRSGSRHSCWKAPAAASPDLPALATPSASEFVLRRHAQFTSFSWPEIHPTSVAGLYRLTFYGWKRGISTNGASKLLPNLHLNKCKWHSSTPFWGCYSLYLSIYFGPVYLTQPIYGLGGDLLFRVNAGTVALPFLGCAASASGTKRNTSLSGGA